MTTALKWFMSYSWQTPDHARSGFGCCTADAEEHPIAKVMRWNKDYPDRRIVLLHYHRLEADEQISMDVEN